MDTYDYRQDTDSINETQAKIDLLSEKEAKQVSEFISSLKEQSAKEQSTALLERFTSALLPSPGLYLRLKKVNNIVSWLN